MTTEAAAKPAAASLRPAPDDIVQELEAVGIAAGSYDFKPLDPVRRTIARRMTESFRDVPHFPLLAKIEVDRLLELRTRINTGDTKVSLNDMIIKAAALALKAAPEANASYTAKGLVYHHSADIAVAVAIEGGLITPILRKAETKSLQEISTEMRDLAARARIKRLMPNEYFGGTFSISNLGMFGVSSFGSVLNPPQGCILSVGETERMQRFRGDEPYLATVLHATLTCDHRVVDGATGARWLQAFKKVVEAPDELA
jgi:pyruvate dehydrogenase E2 component (dihydrolipoamide acetyltransferase)